MKITPEQKRKKKIKMDRKAKSLGFESTGLGMIYIHKEIVNHPKVINKIHPLGWVGSNQMMFDFSAVDPDKIAVRMYTEGVKVGKLLKEQELRESLGLS